MSTETATSSKSVLGLAAPLVLSFVVLRSTSASEGPQGSQIIHLGLRSVLLAGILSLIWSLFIYPTFFSPLRHIPRARADWRSRLYRWVYLEPNPDTVWEWIQKTPHEGLVRYSGIGGVQRVTVLNADAAKDVLISQAYSATMRPPRNRERFTALFGEGLLSAEGDIHKLQKKKMLPAFAPRIIRDLYPEFWSKSCEMVQRLGAEIQSSTARSLDVEINSWTARASLDLIGVAAWGRDFHALENPDSEFVHKYHAMFMPTASMNRQAKYVYAAALLVPMSLLARLFPCEFFQTIATGKRAVRAACIEAIDEKKQRASADASGSLGKDILGNAMSTGAFDDEGLIDQMGTILAAGHETTALSVTFACYLLAQNPAVQTRLRAEVRANLPSPAQRTEVTAEMLESLSYLKAVARETLRVWPVAPVVYRETHQDTMVAGYQIPALTSLVLNPFAMGKMAESWGSDAKLFRPERWLENEALGGAPSSADFLTFSTGPRSCIGKGFAEGEILALLAVLVGRFDLQLTDPSAKMNLSWGIVVRPMDFNMKLSVIDGW